MDNKEEAIVMSRPALGIHHDSNSEVEDSGVESRSEFSWESEDSTLSTSNESHNEPGVGSSIGSCDSDILQLSPPYTDDDYSSDGSHASDDSFVTNLIPARPHPTRRRYPSGYSPHIRKNARDLPYSSSMGVVREIASYSRLEKLPAELRIQILMSMPDLETLHSFITASPIMHTQYLYDRHNILSTCLGRELNGFHVDAYVNMKTRVSEFGHLRDDDVIINFLDSYRNWLAAPATCPSLKSLPPNRIRWMAAYHISVARPLARRYGSWALENFGKEALPLVTTQEAAWSSHDTELSRTEEIRVLRALYRYETYHHLFGYNLGHRRGDLFPDAINEHFFNNFNPWENESVACIDIFVRQQYDDIFDKIQDDLRPHAIRLGQAHGFYHPDGLFGLDGERDNCMNGTVSRGLKTLARALKINKHEELALWMNQCFMPQSCFDATLQESIGVTAQFGRRIHPPPSHDDNDETEERHDSMRFLDDSSLDGPPLAWVLAWHGSYINAYGGFTPKSLKRWGYVIWDARRWDDMGAKELIAQKWKRNPRRVRLVQRHCGWNPFDAETDNDGWESSTDAGSLSDETDISYEDSSSDEGSLSGE